MSTTSDVVRLSYGPWYAECTPADGARLTCLNYGDTALLTGAPVSFRPPAGEYGLFETRPVFGYDDCFPTVDPGRCPVCNIDIPDHGEMSRSPDPAAVWSSPGEMERLWLSDLEGLCAGK